MHHPVSSPLTPSARSTKARRFDRDGDHVPVPADIHDIRVLTATGPIPLPLTRTPALDAERPTA